MTSSSDEMTSSSENMQSEVFPFEVAENILETLYEEVESLETEAYTGTEALVEHVKSKNLVRRRDGLPPVCEAGPNAKLSLIETDDVTDPAAGFTNFKVAYDRGHHGGFSFIDFGDVTKENKWYQTNADDNKHYVQYEYSRGGIEAKAYLYGVRDILDLIPEDERPYVRQGLLHFYLGDHGVLKMHTDNGALNGRNEMIACVQLGCDVTNFVVGNGDDRQSFTRETGTMVIMTNEGRQTVKHGVQNVGNYKCEIGAMSLVFVGNPGEKKKTEDFGLVTHHIGHVHKSIALLEYYVREGYPPARERAVLVETDLPQGRPRVTERVQESFGAFVDFEQAPPELSPFENELLTRFEHLYQ